MPPLPLLRQRSPNFGAFLLILLCSLFVGGWYSSPPRQTDQAPNHTLRIESGGFHTIQMEVDGVPVFRGVLVPHEVREWRGQTLTLTIESHATASNTSASNTSASNRSGADRRPTTPTTVTFDGLLQGTLQPTDGRTILQWPRAQQSPLPTTERAPSLYTVQPDDTLFLIAQAFGTDVDALLTANQISDVNLIYAGTTLIIPGGDGSMPVRPIAGQLLALDGAPPPIAIPRGSVTERLTLAAQQQPTDAPFHQQTWLTYYGRPAVPVMGILGEYEIDELVPLLRAEAAAYDEANGDELAVLPAFHLVYGMATKAPNPDGSHLIFLEDATVERYIERANAEGFAVILDIQIGALSPAEALAQGLPWLDYANVHLALDPEFAMAHAGQLWPGDPIGYVTAAEINAAQALMQQYLAEHDLPGQRVLLVHQFLDTMIENKAELVWTHDRLALTISADGWGGPWGKISKYNLFMDPQTRFTAFKLFYRWDEPLMTPREALGVDGFGEQGYIEVTPNLIMYQ